MPNTKRTKYIKGPSQPLLCSCLHLGTRLSNTQSPRGIVRLSVEWFMSRKNNRRLGWKRITENIRILIMGETALYRGTCGPRAKIPKKIVWNVVVRSYCGTVVQIWSQFNQEMQVYFTSRTLVFTNSHQLQSTKSLYKFPLEASNLYLQWYSIGFNQL